MFTGIIEELGEIAHKDRKGMFQRTVVRAPKTIEDVDVGDSVNINGACQTVVEIADGAFVFESVEETLKRTTLGDLKAGDKVNLERSLRLEGRLGGHLVLGHVDGVGKILKEEDQSQSLLFTIEFPETLGRYIASKGSIALDGISLTVVSALSDRFTVAVIPFTLEHTTLGTSRIGDRVNLEVDILARYVERLMEFGGESDSGVTYEQLEEMGL